MNRTDDLTRLARTQHGVVSRRQLTEMGVTRPAVSRAVASGRLERVSPRVLRIPGSGDTPEQRAMTAVLDGPGAVAAHSAAALWQLPGFVLEPVHVLATRRPHRDRGRAGPMHSSTRLSEDEVTSINGIPVTTPLRTLRDLAGRIHPHRLSQVCDRMLSDRLIRLADLHALGDALPRRGGAPGTSTLRRLILARPVGYRPVDSNLELRFEAILAEAGEAPFERQADVGDEIGPIGRVDFIDRRLRVIVEVQSARFHAGLVDAARDAERLARLRRAGWIVVEVTDHEVWHRRDLVLARVRAARATARARAARTSARHLELAHSVAEAETS